MPQRSGFLRGRFGNRATLPQSITDSGLWLCVPRLLEVCLFSSSQSKFYLPKKQLKQLLRKVPHEFTHCK